MIRRIPVALFGASLSLGAYPLSGHAQSPTSSKAILEALTTRSKAMDVQPSIALKVAFALNSAELTAEGRAQLDELARALQSPELEGKRFALKGHTDATGTPAFNEALSERRAQSVKAYLTGRYGIDADRLRPKGYGATQLLLPGEPTHGSNRRVEVEALK